jgi:hypothetical protein
MTLRKIKALIVGTLMTGSVSLPFFVTPALAITCLPGETMVGHGTAWGDGEFTDLSKIYAYDVAKLEAWSECVADLDGPKAACENDGNRFVQQSDTDYYPDNAGDACWVNSGGEWSCYVQAEKSWLCCAPN